MPAACFLNYARDSLADWDAIRNTLMEESGELHGEISMYCSVTASYSFLFEILTRFRRDHPRIEIKLHTGDPEDAIARVLCGDEDITIGAQARQTTGWTGLQTHRRFTAGVYRGQPKRTRILQRRVTGRAPR